MTHPAVSLVAVVGVPDERLGEEVKAFIVRKPGARSTEDESSPGAREHGRLQIPAHVEFREQLPMTATGKILKRELRAGARAV